MVLLKSLKLLRSGMENIPPATTCVGEKEFADMKRRMEEIMVGKYGVESEIISCDTGELNRMISYDDQYVYVDKEAF